MYMYMNYVSLWLSLQYNRLAKGETIPNSELVAEAKKAAQDDKYDHVRIVSDELQVL